jgi:hypothetical protein
MNTDQIKNLPGAHHIIDGLRDLAANRHTIASCLVRIARYRLARTGLIPKEDQKDDNAELDLYAMLSHEGNQAHSRYNSLIRELVSFEHALDHQWSRSTITK